VPYPTEAALALSDCIRCLRSALDYLVSSLARAADLEDERTAFPFHKERKNVDDMFLPPRQKGTRTVKAGSLYDVGSAYPDLKEIILNLIQPWSADDGANPRGDMLWRIITTDSIDKHRLITPVLTAIDINHASVGNGGTIVGCRVINAGGIFPFAIPGGPDLERRKTLPSIYCSQMKLVWPGSQ
jgi:hypothetical protein